MNVRKWSTSLVPMAGTVLVALAAGTWGCGPSTVVHDSKAEYTPQALADELVYRLGLMKGPAAKPPEAGKKAEVSLEEQGGRRDEASKGDSKKDPNTLSVDDIVSDIGTKARTVKGQDFAATCHEVAALVSKNTTLDPGVRDSAVKKLESLATTP